MTGLRRYWTQGRGETGDSLEGETGDRLGGETGDRPAALACLGEGGCTGDLEAVTVASLHQFQDPRPDPSRLTQDRARDRYLVPDATLANCQAGRFGAKRRSEVWSEVGTGGGERGHLTHSYKVAFKAPIPSQLPSLY